MEELKEEVAYLLKRIETLDSDIQQLEDEIDRLKDIVQRRETEIEDYEYNYKAVQEWMSAFPS